ncbi:conjugal transfer protein TraG N-terminal domain-containing protein [Candidatus Thiothrix anitrata]|uniref:Conjugal transfer protein TraG N-terminal domain-containing protein n=1 Tax=Candidatus Thiothrix anitrata TaxID=2823902 RepID=A0ABX7X8L9_9GAMM|nr:conjugal transfer protein TraG N-terminal domain-containing protein [Candidatus Thiothrix anitrata]QTR51578.1 conjugal transfer protein TraG N-terminal domain-containing protein [Candidatus Thiothrix anitrata]
MALDIYTFGSGSYVVEALHAVKMFMGSGSYTTLVRIAGLIGLLWVMLVALRNKNGGGIQADWSWLLFFAFFYVGLLVPKVDLIVNDPLDPPTTASPVVTNVPLGLGIIAYITSGIGKGLVDKYETFITIPGDQKYSTNGMLFGANVMRSFGEMEFPDARFSSDINQFIGHCLFPQINASNPHHISGVTLSIDAFATGSDLWTHLKTYAQTNRWIEFSDGVVRTCREAANNLDTRTNGMTAQVNNAAGQAGQKIWPTKGVSDAQAAFLASAGGTTATDFLGYTQTGADLTRQAMMIKAVSGALEGASIDSDNQSMAQAIYQAKAESQQRNTYIMMGNTASRTLPVMKAVMEAIAYAIAPLVFLFILMPGGVTALGQYAMFMVWLQMWPILYAVINSVMYWYGSQSSLNAALLSNGAHGLTLESMNSVNAVNADMVALAGYMAISIPMISYMLLKGGMAAGGAVYSSLMQPANSTASAAAGEQTSGAMTMNTLTMDNASWGGMNANKMDTNRSMAFGMSSVTDPGTGTKFTSTSTGGMITQMQKSDYAYGTQMDSAIKSSVSASARESVTAARMDSAEYMASTSSLLSDMKSFSHQVQQSTGTTDTATQQKSAQLAQSVDKMESIGRDFASSRGLSYQTGLGLLASASQGISLSGRADAKSQEDYREAVKVAESSGFKDSMQTAQQLSTQLSATRQDGVSDSTARNLQAGLQQNNALAEKAAASYQRAQAFETVRARLEEHGISFGGDISNFMRTRLGVSENEFISTQAMAYQTNDPASAAAAIQKMQGWVDSFVNQGGAAALVGIQSAPNAAGVDAFHAANRADITQQGNAGVQGLQHSGAGAVSGASGNAGLDINRTAPAGYYEIAHGTQAGMAQTRTDMSAAQGGIQETGDRDRTLITDMATRNVADAGLERTSDNTLSVLPQPIGDGLKFANQGMTDIVATGSGLSQGIAGAVERFATGREQDWNTDYNAGFNRVAQSELLTPSQNGSTNDIYNELYGKDEAEAQKKSSLSEDNLGYAGSGAVSGNPVAGGGRISSGFGGREHPVLGGWRHHAGIDIAAPRGTQVSATGDGVVKFSGEKGAYGNIVIIDHGGGVETRYAHLDSFAMGMREGQMVRDGDLIGTVGSTGRSTGNHLHYEVRENGKAVNPSRHL